MPVPPHHAAHTAWLVRFVVALALVALGMLAILAPHPTDTPAATVGAAATPVAVTLAPTLPAPTLAPRPTQTPQPITSIIVRDYTPPPFPTNRPVAGNLPSVSIVDFSYFPGSVQIKAGQSVLWRNDGSEEHDVTGDDWHSGMLEPTYTYRLTFGIPGTYTYRCSIHLDMVGSVVVT